MVLTRRAGAASVLTMTLLAGCGSTGRYTKEVAESATTRMNAIRAETERTMAEQSFLSGKLDRAEERLRDAIGIDPSSAGLHVLMARVNLEQNKIRSALTAAARGVGLAPDDPGAHYVLGLVHERAGNPAEAMGHYQRAAELDPEDAHAVLAATELIAELSGPERADAYLSSWEGARYDPGAMQMLGRLALLRGDAAAAAARFAEARVLAPMDLGLMVDHASALMALSRFAEAEPILAAARATPGASSRPDLAVQHAVCLREAGQLARSRDLFLELARANHADRDAPRLWAAVGELSFRIGDHPRVREAASRLTGSAPADRRGYMLWALWHLHGGDIRAASRSVAEGIERGGPSEELSLLAAAVEAMSGGAGGAVLTGVSIDE